MQFRLSFATSIALMFVLAVAAPFSIVQGKLDLKF
jgi:hypothetical protein